MKQLYDPATGLIISEEGSSFCVQSPNPSKVIHKDFAPRGYDDKLKVFSKAALRDKEAPTFAFFFPPETGISIQLAALWTSTPGPSLQALQKDT